MRRRRDDDDYTGAYERDNIEVVDTSKCLTKEELQALKQLASMSKTAKYVTALIFGCIALFGFDRVIGWIGHLGK